MIPPANDFTPWHGVFETLLVIKGRPLFVAEHRAELDRSMAALSLKSEFDFEKAREAMPPKSGRLRWIVSAGTTHAIFFEEDVSPAKPVALSVSPVRVGSHNWDARFKTLSYLSHAQAFETAPTGEAILLNEHGHVASAARGNLFWRRGDRLYTPAHETGCRCGVVRGFVLKHEKVEEGSFPLSDLIEAQEIFLTNSMKGIASVREIEGKPITSTTTADKLRATYAEAIDAQMKAH